MNGTPWSVDELALLRDVYPHLSTRRVAEALRRPMASVYGIAKLLGIRKTTKYLASPEACRLRRGENVGAAFRFAKGHVPANKGLRRPGYAAGRMRETQFKAGERRGAANPNWKPIGTVLRDTDGYLRVKLREAVCGLEATGFGNQRVWAFVHRRTWEQAHGPIPEGHAVVFRDGKRENCAIENLECVSRRELMRRNTVWNYPRELAEAIQLNGALKRKLRRLEP